MIPVVLMASLLAYAVVASQPLAYVFFLGRAQRALSAPAYIELRRCINPVMNRRVPLAYGSSLAMLLWLLVVAARGGASAVFAAAAVALLCLLVDAALMLRANLPINGVMDGWSASDYPADWELYRARWFAIFAYRQAALLAGFFALLAGAAFR